MRISGWSSDVCSSDRSHQRPEEVDKEDYQPCGHDNITKGGDLVPIRVGTSVIRDTPGHSAHPQEVHREEQNVYADEEDPEMNMTQELVERSEERRVGKECGSTGRYRWTAYH